MSMLLVAVERPVLQGGEGSAASAHARVCDDAGPARISRSRHGPSRLTENISPELVLRPSIPGLRTPLSTLRLQPHDRTHMTRGRCGSLRLHRNGLAPSTLRRSPGAPVHSIISRLNCGKARRVQLHRPAEVCPPCRARSVRCHIRWVAYRVTPSAGLLCQMLPMAPLSAARTNPTTDCN
jgi:hypothetical protein